MGGGGCQHRQSERGGREGRDGEVEGEDGGADGRLGRRVVGHRGWALGGWGLEKRQGTCGARLGISPLGLARCEFQLGSCVSGVDGESSRGERGWN